MTNISYGLAFLAGMASFLSPCVFSLVPVYISYLGGENAARLKSTPTDQDRYTILVHGLMFVIGFSAVFVILGTFAGALGGVITPIRFWLTRVGGIVVIILGLHMTGLIRIPFLNYELRRHTTLEKTGGLLPAFLMGVFFSAGWTPCVGPVLGAILTLAFTGGSLVKGAILLTFYSFGLGLPFIVTAIAINWVSGLFRRFIKFLHAIEIIMGIVLIIVGVMLFIGTFNQLARYGIFVDFGL